ncbi:MAG: hopanoid biosynthesis protein HpnM [Gammaproteobacteria bacterium]|nr:hopanoid biosynthesis protein HpnM [Gammaproteobacteria bacterium]
MSDVFGRDLKQAQRLIFTLLISSLPFTVLADLQPSQGAADVVTQLQSELISVMKRSEVLGYQGRYDSLAPIVRATHNLPDIARIVVGRYWGRLTEVQRKVWVENFSQLSIATYAYKFDGYSGELFEPISQQETARGDKFIRTLLIKSDGEEIRFDYLLRRGDDGWSIINIIADGVSDLALKRSEYSGIIRREGFDALIMKLKDKIAKYSLDGKD